MSFFSRILSLLLAVTVTVSSFGLVKNTPFGDEFSNQHEATSGSLDFSILSTWDILYLDSDETNSLNDYSYLNSEEKEKTSSEASFAREASFKRFASQYLLISRKIDNSLSLRELLYPFYFYF